MGQESDWNPCKSAVNLVVPHGFSLRTVSITGWLLVGKKSIESQSSTVLSPESWRALTYFLSVYYYAGDEAVESKGPGWKKTRRHLACAPEWTMVSVFEGGSPHFSTRHALLEWGYQITAVGCCKMSPLGFCGPLCSHGPLVLVQAGI